MSWGSTHCIQLQFLQMWLWTEDSYTHEGAWSKWYPDVDPGVGENARLTGQDEVERDEELERSFSRI